MIGMVYLTFRFNNVNTIITSSLHPTIFTTGGGSLHSQYGLDTCTKTMRTAHLIKEQFVLGKSQPEWSTFWQFPSVGIWSKPQIFRCHGQTMHVV